jgi:hypothetical protein
MPKKPTAAMANGEHIYFSHHILLKVATCGIVYSLKTSVCSSISYDMVLGTDFYVPNKININFQKSKLEIVHDSVLRNSKACNIPPNSILTIYTQIPEHANGNEAIFEPNINFMHSGVLVPKQLISINHSSQLK